jgi:protein SCO1/2
VCPTELQAVSAALDRLGPDAAKIAPLFVTIDPDRDTPRVMADYVKLFDPRLIGLTGSPGQIHDIAAAYRVYYAKVTPKGATEYLMDHSSFLYLMGPDGTFRALLRPGGTAEDLAAAIESRLHS